jgi:hypothetical protein
MIPKGNASNNLNKGKGVYDGADVDYTGSSGWENGFDIFVLLPHFCIGKKRLVYGIFVY